MFTEEHILDRADKQLLKEYFLQNYHTFIDPNFLEYMADWSDEFNLDDYEKLYKNWSKHKTCTFSSEVLSYLYSSQDQDMFPNLEQYLEMYFGIDYDPDDDEQLKDYGLENSVEIIDGRWMYKKEYLNSLKSLVSENQ